MFVRRFLPTVCRLSPATILLIGLTAVADSPPPELGAPFHIGGEPVYGPRWSAASSPSIAFDGTNYLTVWTDWSGEHHGKIFGGRITPGGAVLDSIPIAVSRRPSYQTDPEVAFDGANYFVVWEEVPRWAPGRDTLIPSIYGARVSPEGEVLDPEGFFVHSPGDRSAYPSIVCGDSNCFVVWADQHLNEVLGLRISRDGTVLDSEPIAVYLGDSRRASVAFDGENYLVLWSINRDRRGDDIVGTRVSLDGDLLDRPFFVVTEKYGFQVEPAVTFDGTDYVVAWLDSGAGKEEGYEIYATRVSTDAEVFNTFGVPVSRGFMERRGLEMSAGGGNAVVLWSFEYEKYRYAVAAARLSPDLNLLDTDPIPVSTLIEGQPSVGVAFDGANHMMVMTESHEGSGHQPTAKRFTTAGEILDPAGILHAWGANEQSSPAIAYDGEHYMAVWLDKYDGHVDLYAGMIPASGIAAGLSASAIGADRFVVAKADTANYQFRPSISSNGESFLVACQYREFSSHGDPILDFDIHLVRVSSNGVPLDENPIVLTANEMYDRNPAVASDGNDYMVVFEEAYEIRHDYDYSYFVFRPVATRVSAGGDILNQEFIHLPGEMAQQAIEYGGGAYLVVGFDGGIVGARLSPAGQLLDQDLIEIASASYPDAYPSLAFDGSSFLAVWSAEGDIYGARITPGGAVLDPGGFTISDVYGPQLGATVAFDGTYFNVMWHDGRSGGRELYGARVTVDGELIDPQGFPVVTGGGYAGWPRAATGESGQFVAVYSQFTYGPPFESERVWAKFWNRIKHSPSVRIIVTPTLTGSSTRIGFNLPSHAKIRLDIFDAAGRRIKMVARGCRGPGWSYEVWDGTDNEGRRVQSGVYFARIGSRHGSAHEKIIFIK
jgi:hypothetical protein